MKTSRKPSGISPTKHHRIFREAEKIAGIGYWEIFPEDDLVTVSENARRIYGLKGTSWTIDEVRQISLPEYQVMLGQAFADLIAGRKAYDVEFKIRRPCDNEVIDIHSMAEYDPLEHRVFGVFVDITRQKQIEQEIKDRELRYRLLAENANDVIWSITLDGRFTYVSPSVYQLRGYTPEEVMQQALIETVCPSSVEVVTEGLRRLATDADTLEKESPSFFEIEQPRKDGTAVWTEVSLKLVRDKGRPSHLLGVSRDISKRKETEAALKQSEQALRHSLSLLASTLEATADGILVVDSARQVQRYNSRFVEMWHMPKKLLDTRDDKKLLQFALSQLTNPDNFLGQVEALYSQPETPGFDVLKFKDGRIFERYSCQQRLNDIIVGRVWSFRDITNRKHMEDQLLHAAEEWRATFDAIKTPLSIQDRNYKILRVNKAFADAMKLSPENLIGKTCFEVSHNTSEPVSGCPHRLTLNTGAAAEVEIHDPVTGAYSMVSTYPMFGPDGEVVASVHISHDITERKRLQERLMITNRLASVGELAAGIAHEINNPLTGVLGFSELVLSADIPPAIREDVKVIHSEAQRAAEIVRNLLTFARRHNQVRQPLSINEVIQRVMTLRAYDQRLNNIETLSNLGPGLPEINADFFQLQQVFLNIFLNAEYFMIQSHGRGELRITSSWLPETNNVRIEFTDNGPGIKPENLGRLFDPFFTTKDVGQGTGLGLSMSHGIIGQHGGKLWAESEPGCGATFIIELPVNQPATDGT
ncbi:sensory box sensor histidine kinase [Dehalogenimonas sp. WBC-2]|nr:sensory box sensor histidine kinase [Dehalogenimonas sp. WBC-2]